MDAMNYQFHYKKKNYSEEVIRRALYWLSRDCEWLLDDADEDWKIEIITDENDDEKQIKAELDRLINDYVLREKIDKKTKSMRFKIVHAALSRIANGD